MSIKVLSQDVVNQIAAGEVVERPAHLVKELIENSLDAGATQIQIEVSVGGQFIKITDNGKGIQHNELGLALQRHATSKISLTEDLWKLQTYGFRGEALASAAAVSDLTLISKPSTQEKAFQIKSQFGSVMGPMDGSLSNGTQIMIERLFENVPARLKFLKSDSAEISQIRQVIKALALVYDQVEFKFIENGKLDLFFKVLDKNSESDQQGERVKQVLGLDKIYFQDFIFDTFKVKAFFSSPYDVQKTSKNIWIFAQKRWIQDKSLQVAVIDAYRSLLMHGEYPLVVIDLHCATDEIDVNIHPTKSQVKFADAAKAFRAVHHAVRNGLEKAPWLAATGVQPELVNKNQDFVTNSNSNQVFDHMSQIRFGHSSTVSSGVDYSLEATQFKTKTTVYDQMQSLRVDTADVKPQQNKAGHWSSMQIIGQLNLTYIICQRQDRMVLVDQHAAHERVAFEKLMRKWKTGSDGGLDIQDYLFPLAIDLSVEKVEALMKCEADIKRMGIEIEMLGPSVLGIKSAPLFVKESALPKVFDKMAHDLIEHGGSHVLEKSIIDIFATMACHSVVRAGQSLSEPEMQELLVAMDEFPLSSFCPHGRPVSVEYSFYDIEKQFGRLV